MKKLLLFVAAFFTFSFAQAQDGLKLGLKAGVNLSNFAGDGADADYKFGGHGGLFANFGISEMVSIQPELLFTMKGAQEKEGDITTKVKLNYIDVPVLAHINADGLFFELGPTLSFNVSSKVTMNDEDGNEISGDFDGVNSVDFGYAAGIGYQLQNGISIGLRYNGGLSDIAENSKTRNSNFLLSVGYTFTR
ncbi:MULTISPECIES: porin family protein [Rufibacter]|uniref:Outer membrane protein beta-barrel domain-containing protein n=1 Tax=Rufibacter quisquiliarum TaxID=1549639 RepID=A0A839GF89_9BACT|nr:MULTISPECIES: porin family protein [Rufibacter]MBA9076213.1 hypothetical protein [Rufibacter quisquiliarum]